MKKKIATLIFRIALPIFYLMVRAKLSFIRRDLVEFGKFGVTDETLTELDTLADSYAALPPDDDLVGQQVITTKKKDAEADIVREATAKILNRAENRFGRNSGEFRRFGVTGLSDLVDMQLYLAASNTQRVATIYLPDMAEQGLTAPILTEYDVIVKSYHKAVIDQMDAFALRDIATDNRIKAANELYLKISKHCETGKKIWGSVNEAKYNDYVIYDTPSGEPEEGENPV